MAKGKLKIHSENILPIIKKWLYTDKDIFLRELVSNACDALSKIKTLRDRGECNASDEELAIDVTLDPEAKTLTIADTGIGMSASEVKEYIAQVAFSSAEAFVKKYESDQDAIIGHFGLGFYSAFMVSSSVDIDTLSYQEGAEAAFWSCDGSPEYTMKKGSRTDRGTTITLHLSDDEFLDANRITSILNMHCRFLPYPITFNGVRINEKEPLWIKSASSCTDEEYLDLYRTLYPMEPDPIFWIHLDVDYPFHLKGILYFPKITKQFDFTKTSVHLYCNRVFVSDSCKDILPDYLTVLRGVIDSPDIPLNVSRSSLQMDRTVRQLGSHISKKVSDKLTSLLTHDRDAFLQRWANIELIVKLGMLQDEKFYERAKACLHWKTTQGEWRSVEELKEGTVFYHNSEEETHFLEMYHEKHIDVLRFTSHLDQALANFLENKLQGVKFQRIDGGIHDELLDKEREKTVLDADGRSQASKIADFFKKQLSKEKLEVEAKSLANDELPAFIMIDEHKRRMRDYLAVSSGDHLPKDLMNEHTFIVNTNNKLIGSIEKLSASRPELAQSLVHQLYELSLLSHKELDPKEFSGFLKRSNALLENLATSLVE